MTATIKRRSNAADIFADARSKFTIADAWTMLALPGTPKASCKSPFREDKNPSFSIHSNGTAWTDHATGEGGDVVEFIRLAIRGDHREVRQWLMERINTASFLPPITPTTKKSIQWPAELHEGHDATWKAFVKMRGLTYPAVHTMVKSGILRFTRINGASCYVITDGENRAAEIRRIDGKLFGEHKAYPLRGVDKTWLPGLHLLRNAPKTTAVLITEGATDLLVAIDLYSQYRRNEGTHSWQPAALLGAGCKTLCNEAQSILRGRHVRLVPDGDDAGDKMADHWTQYLRKHGCSVDVVNLPRKTDLSDHIKTISTTDLFSK